MKKILSVLVIVLPLLFSLFLVNTVSAQTAFTPLPALGTAPSLSTAVTAATTPASVMSAPKTTAAPASGFWARMTGGLLNAVINGLMFYTNMGLYITYTIAMFFVYLMGVLFNLAITVTISNISAFLPKNVMAEMWTLFRDLTNVIFVFILLYTGFQTILGNGGSKIKSIIINVIIASILLNFSMWGTEVAIDASNIVSLGIYNQIETSLLGHTEASSGALMASFGDAIASVANSAGGGLAGAYISATNVGKTLQPVPTEGGSSAIVAGTANAIFSALTLPVRLVLNTVVLFLAGVLLLVSAVVFLWRYVVIIFLIILSPLALLGWVFPELKSVTDGWKKRLFHAMFYPPVFFLLIYISIKLLKGINEAKTVDFSFASGSDFAASLGISTANLVFTCILALIFLGIPLYASHVSADESTKVLDGVGDKMKGFVKSGVGAATGYAGRGTLGKIGKNLSEKMENSKLGNSYAGRLVNEATFRKLKDNKYGSSMNIADKEKLEKDIKKQDALIDKMKDHDVNLKAHGPVQVQALANDRLELARQEAIIKKSDETLADPTQAALHPQATADKAAANTRKTSLQASIRAAEPLEEKIANTVDGLSYDEMKKRKSDFTDNKGGSALHVTDAMVERMDKDDEMKEVGAKIVEHKLKGLQTAVDSGNVVDIETEMKNITGATLARLDPARKEKIATLAGHTLLKGKAQEDMTKGMNAQRKTDIDRALNGYFIANPEKISGLKQEELLKLKDNTLKNGAVSSYFISNPKKINNLSADIISKLDDSVVTDAGVIGEIDNVETILKLGKTKPYAVRQAIGNAISGVGPAHPLYQYVQNGPEAALFR